MSKVSLFTRYFANIALIYYTLALVVDVANAQPNLKVESDGSLSTQVTKLNDGEGNFIITGGTKVGQNLFHSFKQFSVPNNGSAIFENNLSIENIFSRVTGNNISQIEGIIETKGLTNLFLINPNGITFGKNAQLSVGGSFIATTAEQIDFAGVNNPNFSTNRSTTPFIDETSNISYSIVR